MVEFAIVLFIQQRCVGGFGRLQKSFKSVEETGSVITTINPVGNVTDDGKCRGQRIFENGSKKDVFGEDARKEGIREASVLTSKIDLVSIVLFSIAYFIFNGIYCYA